MALKSSPKAKHKASKYELDEKLIVEEKIEKFLDENYRDLSGRNLTDFIVAAVEKRERSKFEFSKLLSFIFVQIKKFFHRFNIMEDDLQHLSIDDILSFIQKEIDILEIGQIIERNRKLKGIASTIRLPELIRSTDDFYVIPHIASKPNFIGLEKVSGRINHMSKTEQTVDLRGTIVSIENADPGYDWIFGYGIKV